MAQAIAAAALERAAAEQVAGAAGPAAAPSVTDLIARIVRALRDQPGRTGYTFDELEEIVGAPVRDNNDLAISIEQNPQLSLDPVAGRVTYVSAYSIQSRGELLQFLKSQGRSQSDGSGDFLPGCQVKELADAYAHAEAE